MSRFIISGKYLTVVHNNAILNLFVIDNSNIYFLI